MWLFKNAMFIVIISFEIAKHMFAKCTSAFHFVQGTKVRIIPGKKLY